MSLKGFQWTLALGGLIVGVMLSMQFRVSRDIQQNDTIRNIKYLSNHVAQMKKERDVLQLQVAGMRTQLDRLSAETLAPQVKEEIVRAEILSGVTGLVGDGVQVTLMDSSIPLKPGDNPNLYLVHDEDILRVVNELKAAGAESISINGQRLIATTEISCSGPTITINKKPLAPPFIITAIGNPKTMENSLKMQGGVAEILQFYGIQVVVKKLSQVTIPAYTGGIKYHYAAEAS